jgi:hypothetical protein
VLFLTGNRENKVEGEAMTITPEQRHAIEQAGAIRIEDLETHAAHVILKAEVYERLKPSSKMAATRSPKASADLRTHSSATSQNSRRMRERILHRVIGHEEFR